MKRSFIIAILAILIVGSIAVTADAKKKKPRRVERQATAAYDTPMPGVAGVHEVGYCGSPNTGCAQFPTGAHDRFAMFEISDASGLPPTAAVHKSPSEPPIAVFCGKTEEPIAIPAGGVTVTIHVGPSPENICQGAATSGTVTATFSNLP